MIDWDAKALNYKEPLLEDLKIFLKIPTVRDDSNTTATEPLGPNLAIAMKKFEELAKKDGFRVGNYKNLVVYAEMGPEDAEESVAVIGHMDVMPAGDLNKWNSDPFTPLIKDGRIYARGASDDKGPALIGYYALKMIKDLNLQLKRKVIYVMGADEETNWDGMTDFFEEIGEPTMGFSPDAEFPIINGEKGNTSVVIRFSGYNYDGSNILLKFDAGERPNMVPGVAKAIISTLDKANISRKYNEFLKAHKKISGSVKSNENGLEFELIGKQVHGSLPETGINAGTYLANFLMDYDFTGNAKSFLQYLGSSVHDDTKAEKVGAAKHDELMGDLSMNVGIQKFFDGSDGLINLNFRYPQNTSEEAIKKAIEQSLPLDFDASTQIEGHSMRPHYVPEDDVLVSTLLQTFRDHTGLPASGQVIGGGTFGRLLKRGVGFGAMFEGVPDTMHQVNEFYPIADLTRSLAIFADAIWRLTRHE